MRLILSVTFVIILGNTYSSTATTSTDPPTTASSVSSQSLSTTTRDGTTSETSETGTTKTETTESTTTSVSSTSQSISSETMTSTYTESTTTSLDSSTEISTTPSVTSSEMITSTLPTSHESTTNTSSVSPHTSDSTIVSETSVTASSLTEEASTSSGASTTVTETSSSTSSSRNSVTSTVTQSLGASSSSDSTSSSSTDVQTTTISTTSERITTNMTTEGLTTEETTTEETTTEDTLQSSTTEELNSTSSTALSQTTTTPTSYQTTQGYDIKKEKILYAGNTLIPLSINVTFQDCLKENQVVANIIVEILKLDSCKSVATESDYSCGNDTRNVKFGFPVIFHVDVLASSLLEEERIKNETIENITTTIIRTSAGSVHTAELASSYSSITACNTDICKDAVSNNKGFSCKNNGRNCILSSPCSYNNGNCSDDGTCFVQTSGSQYTASCKCKEDDMYTYSGSQCESKAYSWKLWTIIASGVGGGIIVILLFAVVIQCARKKSESFNQKYGYDSGFDDRENLMYDRKYVTSEEYHRKPVPRDDIGEDQVNLQSFENKGYDHWEPSESKETYASMDRHFQDPTFHAQITRPKLTTNKYSGDQLTPF